MVRPSGSPQLRFPSRREAIQSHRAAGGRVAAVFPIHSPRALLRAYGYLPVEVWGPSRVDASLGGQHLQSYTCDVVRNGLSFLLAGGLDEVDLILVPHACDSLQGLGSLLIDLVATPCPVATLYLPRGASTHDRAFLTSELAVLSDRLAEISSERPSTSDLLSCVERESDADSLLAELLAARAWLPIDDPAFYAIVRAREHLPAERFIELATRSLASRQVDRRPGLPLLLSGIVPEPVEFLEVASRAGVTFVGDDLACAGRRCYPALHSEQPLTRLAGQLLGGPPDPTRGDPIAARIDHLVGLANRSGARGVLFYEVKFCEPELFDLPLVRAGLDAAGFPSLVIETELGVRLPRQAATRLEAFVEMLS